MKTAIRILLAMLIGTGVIASLYGLSAYEFVPTVWRFVERRHPALDQAGTRAFTSTGIPGDPLNLAFVGNEDALRKLMLGAHWFVANPIGLGSSVRIALDSVAHRAYAEAPVSSLYVNGRRQDIAFEAPSGKDPSRRHHVRFWKMATPDLLGRTLWVGAATYDSGVGVSHTTGQITHHIAPDVDRERDKILNDIHTVSGVEIKWIDDFQPERTGRNGCGDPYVTDGRLAVIETD